METLKLNFILSVNLFISLLQKVIIIIDTLIEFLCSITSKIKGAGVFVDVSSVFSHI